MIKVKIVKKERKQLTNEEKLSLYKYLKQTILENKEKFKLKKFKYDKLIQSILETILKEERKKTEESILKYIDFKNIDMSSQNLVWIDISETNITFDPQTIKDKDLQYATLVGDFKNKSFDGVNICGTNFSKAINVRINPQKVKDKKILNANVDGVNFCNEPFDEIEYSGTDFSNAINCVLTEERRFYTYIKGIKKRILN